MQDSSVREEELRHELQQQSDEVAKCQRHVAETMAQRCIWDERKPLSDISKWDPWENEFGERTLEGEILGVVGDFYGAIYECL